MTNQIIRPMVEGYVQEDFLCNEDKEDPCWPTWRYFRARANKHTQHSESVWYTILDDDSGTHTMLAITLLDWRPMSHKMVNVRISILTGELYMDEIVLESELVLQTDAAPEFYRNALRKVKEWKNNPYLVIGLHSL